MLFTLVRMCWRGNGVFLTSFVGNFCKVIVFSLIFTITSVLEVNIDEFVDERIVNVTDICHISFHIGGGLCPTVCLSTDMMVILSTREVVLIQIH